MADFEWVWLGGVFPGAVGDPEDADPLQRKYIDSSIHPLASQYLYYPGGGPYSTPDELLANLATRNLFDPRLEPQSFERFSYPQITGGPLLIYLPDVSPSFTEYPFYVEAYNCTFTYFSGVNAPATYKSLVIISALSNAIPPPVGTPDPVTIQLKRDVTISKFSVKPSDASVLPKYAAPVQFIRAKFATTRVAVITPTIVGGFMVYEEVSGVPISPVYIYTAKRKILHIVDASLIDQYRLYTF